MDNSVTIRYATPNDIESLRLIQRNDGFEHVYYLSKDRLDNLFKRGEVFFIAFINEKPVGFGSVDFEIRARLHFLSVVEGMQRRGVGKELMQKILDECRKKDYKKVHAYIETSSYMETFLIKFGFEECGVFRNRYGNGKDASIWSVEL